MCKCVRDADRLDSLKPHVTVNDVSPEFSFKKGSVDLSCTRFKTRIRKSGGQVSLTFCISPVSCLIGTSCMTGTFFVITAHQV